MLNFFRENETVYMVMNYLQGDTLQDFIVTARDLKRDKVFRESTIRSLFDEILRGLRIVHQHKMLHLDIKPANIFITNENKAVLLDFGAAREVLSKEGNFIRPMYTPGFAAPEMYRRDGSLGPWTDIYAIGACIYACMQGYPPNDAPQRLEKDRLALSLSRLRNVYSDNLIEVTEWCMSIDPLSRPQSVFALQKELARETERRYTKLSFGERLKLQLETLKTGQKAERVRRLPGQPQGRPREERRPHGLLLHARFGPLRARRRHGGPPRRRRSLSQLALQTLAALSFQREAKPALKDPLRFLHDACIAGHHQLLRYATEQALIDTPRTTVVACLLQGNAAYWAHCGDSRLYMVRGDKLIARTRDHSYSELQETLSQVVPIGERFNRNVLFTCLGSPGKPVVDTAGPLLLQSGDRVLLCSDGLWGSVSDATIADLLASQPISESVPELVEEALRQGGAKSDNVTAIAVEVGVGRGRGRPERRLDARARRRGVRVDDPREHRRRDARRARRGRDRALDPRDQRGDPALVQQTALMAHPRSACGASPSRGRRRRPGGAGSAASA